MAEDKKECKVIDLEAWRKAQKEKVEQKLLQQILERGNPITGNCSSDKKDDDGGKGFKPVA